LITFSVLRFLLFWAHNRDLAIERQQLQKLEEGPRSEVGAGAQDRLCNLDGMRGWILRQRNSELSTSAREEQSKKGLEKG
jgi:hypothetical protein